MFANQRPNSRDGIRTHTSLTAQGILSPQKDQEDPVFSHVCPQAPAVQTAVETKLDAERQRVLDAWPALPAALRAGILAMIDAARKDG